MFNILESLAQPLLHLIDPEDAHRLAVRGLALVPRPACGPDDRRLAVTAFGLTFPNPVGIAAGFDKNAEASDGMLRARLRFRRIGTVTPRPQAGNPRPRLFRLTEDRAVINRMGFNNDGTRPCTRGSSGAGGAAASSASTSAPTRTRSDRIADYVAGIRAFAELAGYFTVNVSSPNTPGLRDLQQRGVLDDLLARVLEARAAQRAAAPVLLKSRPTSTPAISTTSWRGARARDRRDDRLQHHVAAAGSLRDRDKAKRGRRTVGRTAVRAVDPHAGARPIAGSRAHSR